jgi:hypothetical protein
MGRLEIAVEKTDRGGLDAVGHQPRGRLRQAVERQRPHHRAVRRQPFVDLHHRPVERPRLDHHQREQVRPLLRADLEQVGEAAGDEQRHRGAAPLEERVGAPGGGQPQRHRRQRLPRRRPGHQPRRQHRGLLGRRDLDAGAGGRRGGERLGEGDLTPGGVVAVDRHAGGRGGVRTHRWSWHSRARRRARGVRRQLWNPIRLSGPPGHSCAGTRSRSRGHSAASRRTAAEHRQPAPAEESLRHLPPRRQPQPLPALPHRLDHRPQRARRQHLRPPEPARGIDRQAVGEGPAGVDPHPPGARAHPGASESAGAVSSAGRSSVRGQARTRARAANSIAA